MTRIVEYNIATGHREPLAEVEDKLAAEAVQQFSDHSTDHVVYTESVEDDR